MFLSLSQKKHNKKQLWNRGGDRLPGYFSAAYGNENEVLYSQGSVCYVIDIYRRVRQNSYQKRPEKNLVKMHNLVLLLMGRVIFLSFKNNKKILLKIYLSREMLIWTLKSNMELSFSLLNEVPFSSMFPF